MSDPRKRIVCFNLGTRYLGMAAFQRNDLRDWRVRSFNGKWSKAKESKIVGFLKECLDCWQPDIVACKEIHPSRSSEELNHLADVLAGLLKERGIRPKNYSIDFLKSHLLTDGPGTKKAFGEEMMRRWPVLAHELRKERASRNPYYQRMFEAVALGSMCLKNLNKQ